jgi:Putative amidoligase enzyme (DUF2126)/Bacterial transglutaminase-like N-terminal region
LAIQIALNHRTRFKYDKPVSLGTQVLRSKHFINWQQDPHGNFLARFLFLEKTQEFIVEVNHPFDYSPSLSKDLEPYRAVQPAGQLLQRFIDSVPVKHVPLWASVEPSGVEFGYSMSVHNLNQTPRVTTPYTDEQWSQIEHLAHKVDADLAAGDARLTTGGPHSLSRRA